MAGAASYALARLVRRYDLVDWQRATLLSIHVDDMPAMPRGFRVEPITPEELSGHAIDLPPAVQALRFAKGSTCLAAWNDRDVLIGVTWLTPGGYVEDGMHVRYLLPEDAAWDTALWIAPEHRLGRGFAALWAGTADWLRAHGCSRSFSKIFDYNQASLRAHRRMNPQLLGHIVMLRIGRWQWISCATPRLTALMRPRAVVDLRSSGH